MRTVVIVFGSPARIDAAARSVATVLSADAIGADMPNPWPAIVERLRDGGNIVAQAGSTQAAELATALPIVRSAVHLFDATLVAMWAQGGDEPGLAAAHAEIAPLVDRFLALAEPAPAGVEVVTHASLSTEFSASSTPPERPKTRSHNGRARIVASDPPGHVRADARAVATLARELNGTAPTRAPERPAPLDYNILARLRELPSSRALHGIILGVLTDGATPLGNCLRQNAVTALAQAIADEDAHLTWTLVPAALFDELGADSECQAIVNLATSLQPHPYGDAVSTYLMNIAASFASLVALGPEKARTRLLAPSESLDAGFDAWFRSLRGD